MRIDNIRRKELLLLRELEDEKEEIQKAVGEVIRKLRKQRKQSQEAFAGDCSIHSKY